MSSSLNATTLNTYPSSSTTSVFNLPNTTSVFNPPNTTNVFNLSNTTEITQPVPGSLFDGDFKNTTLTSLISDTFVPDTITPSTNTTKTDQPDDLVLSIFGLLFSLAVTNIVRKPEVCVSMISVFVFYVIVVIIVVFIKRKKSQREKNSELNMDTNLETEGTEIQDVTSESNNIRWAALPPPEVDTTTPADTDSDRDVTSDAVSSIPTQPQVSSSGGPNRPETTIRRPLPAPVDDWTSNPPVTTGQRAAPEPVFSITNLIQAITSVDSSDKSVSVTFTCNTLPKSDGRQGHTGGVPESSDDANRLRHDAKTLHPGLQKSISCSEDHSRFPDRYSRSYSDGQTKSQHDGQHRNYSDGQRRPHYDGQHENYSDGQRRPPHYDGQHKNNLNGLGGNDFVSHQEPNFETWSGPRTKRHHGSHFTSLDSLPLSPVGNTTASDFQQHRSHFNSINRHNTSHIQNTSHFDVNNDSQFNRNVPNFSTKNVPHFSSINRHNGSHFNTNNSSTFDRQNNFNSDGQDWPVSNNQSGFGFNGSNQSFSNGNIESHNFNGPNQSSFSNGLNESHFNQQNNFRPAGLSKSCRTRAAPVPPVPTPTTPDGLGVQMSGLDALTEAPRYCRLITPAHPPSEEGDVYDYIDDVSVLSFGSEFDEDNQYINDGGGGAGEDGGGGASEDGGGGAVSPFGRGRSVLRSKKRRGDNYVNVTLGDGERRTSWV